MPEPLILTAGLTKRYDSGVLAVDALDLVVERGQVHGFLGPNGAGKTTTLRMLVGLIRPTSGTATVAGRPAGEPTGLARVGAMVEEPAFYPYLSGRDNLRVVARCCGLGDAAADRGLDWVGLRPAGGFRFKAYSTGMKQRLGLAAALLKDPDLLLLDEPSNGLDPEGIIWMRELLRGFSAKGGAVLVSSHLLSEVEQVCDRATIIQSGRLLYDGPVSGLRTGVHLEVEVTPLEAGLRVVSGIVGPEAVREERGRLVITAPGDRAAEINRALVTAGLEVSELRRREGTLEQAFLRLTAPAEAPAPPPVAGPAASAPPPVAGPAA